MVLTPEVPEEVPDDIETQIRDACNNVSMLTMEDREYRLDASEFSDDEDVRTDYNDLPYVVRGETQMVSEVAVAIDDNGTLALGDDFVRVAFQLDTRPGHVKERGKDMAGRIYDAMEEAGIERPDENPRVGVQFGNGVVAVENHIDLNRGDN